MNLLIRKSLNLIILFIYILNNINVLIIFLKTSPLFVKILKIAVTIWQKFKNSSIIKKIAIILSRINVENKNRKNRI